MSWLSFVPEDIYNRLCACKNKKEDLPVLVNAKWKWMQKEGKDKEGYTKEDAVVEVLETLSENSQWQLANISNDEWDELAK
jgi:hypothetical protein